MNQVIYKYKIFKSSEELEQWQATTTIGGISSICPVNIGVTLDIGERHLSSSVGKDVVIEGAQKTVLGVMVNYYDYIGEGEGMK